MRALVLAMCACGASAPATPKGAPASLEATSAGSGDAIVARVDGHPVWGSCVAVQAARAHVDARAALEQCVDFELLAQAAAKRGLERDPEVVDATRDALVNQLVARAYEDAFTTPDDFGPVWTDVMIRHKALNNYKHGEYRGSAYVRVTVKAPPPAEDPAARAVAERVAAALAPERGLFSSDLVDIARRAAGDIELDHGDVPPYQHDALDPAYADALWAIPEVGRTSPVVRTSWGYDVVLWTEEVAATNPTTDELVHEALPEVQRAFFATWVNRLARAMNLHVETEPDAEQRLEATPQ
ncbi:MAG TPA: hypothetical protein VMJ10_00785 [Kofleriaceae bacterium]|nr:hypothetical protein [Kofleriaceae bacterium]